MKKTNNKKVLHLSFAKKFLILLHALLLTANYSFAQPACGTAITCPGNISACSTTPNIGVPTTFGVCGVASLLNDAPPSFPVGTTSVTWTLTDNFGNTATCAQQVTVITPFTSITCPPDITACTNHPVLGTPVTSGACGVASLLNDAPATFPVGTTSVTWTLTDNGGNSVSCIQNVNILSAGALGSIGNITGPATVCSHTVGANYSVAMVTNAVSYLWTAPANATITSGQGTRTVTVDFNGSWTSGTLSVVATNGCTNSITKILALKSILAAPSYMYGSKVQCSGSTAAYTCTAVTGASGYTWAFSAPGAVIAGQGTTSVSVTYPAFTTGTLSVTADNVCGSSIQKTLAITNTPANVTAIAGPTVVCANTTGVTYTATVIAGATSYIWTLPANTSGSSTSNSITVNFLAGWTSGSISVAASSGCATSIAKVLALKSVLGSPGTIAGAAYSCPNTTGNYTILPLAGASSYTWSITGNATVSGTSTTAAVSFGSGFTTGTLSVVANNACGNGPARTFAIKSTVGASTSIAGNLYNICNSSNTYTCAVIAGATSYVWSVPSGITISSGQGTSSIVTVVSGSFMSGSLSVTGYNACGPGGTKTITVYGRPNTPGVITASPTSWCAGTTVNFSTVPVSPLPIYTWTITGTSVITAGQGTSAVDVAWSSGTATVSVKASNTCGMSAVKTLTGSSSCPPPPGGNRTPIAIENRMEFNLYPNPAQNELTIDLYAESDKDVILEIYDMIGNKVTQQKRSLLNGENSLKTNLGEYQKGIYLIKISDGNNNTLYTQRIMKQ